MTFQEKVLAGGLRGPFGEPRSRTSVVIDAALVAAGLAAALGSVAFAGVMLARGDHKPNVNGMEYLAIFAQPRGASKAASADARPNPSSPIPVGDIDMTPIGSIHPLGRERPDELALVAAQPGIAWLREGATIVAVRPGDQAPGLGRVAAIVLRDGRWILIGETGTALLSSSGSDAPAASAPSVMFGKPMIFGSP